MKNRFRILKLLVVSCCACATTGVFGQTTRTWTGGDGTGTAIGQATNWSGSVSPNSAAGDICQWDGTVAGNLFLTADTANGNFNNGTPGVNFNITSTQVGSLNIRSIQLGGSGNLALNGLAIANGAGAFSFGDGTANVFNIIMRPSSGSSPGPLHDWTNNSASAAIIYPNVRWQSGGGNPHQLRFDGTGDWNVTNNLIFANNTGIFIQKAGAGTFFWAGPSIAGAAGNNSIGSPVDFEGGTVVLKSSGLLGTQRITNNGVMLEYAAPSAQTLSGPIDGTGLLKVSGGPLTLSSGQSDFNGNIDLTNNGVLIVGGTQNIGGTGPLGIGGTILFDGGTLQFSVANTFDYSPRFSMAANQIYKFDTAAQNVTFTNALTSSGGTLTKLGSGVLTLTGANTYGGLTAVGGGKLLIQGSAGSGNIVVSNSTSLGVTTGIQITPATLTVGTSSSATLEFNNVSSTSTALIAAGTVSAGGAITVNVNSGSFTIGQDYPLFSWSSGSAPAVTLGTLTGAGGSLITNGSAIKLHITSLAFVWTGITDGNWDITTANDWKVNGVSAIFANGGTALFDDTVTGQTNVTLNSPVSPASVTVNSSTKIYSLTSSGANLIGGSGGLTKNGNSTLTMAGGVNTYSGATTISGGTLSIGAFANGGSASDIGSAGNGAANLVLNGGTLLYTGGAQDSDHLFTLSTANGTINASGSGALNLTNTGSISLSGSGARTLTLTGTDADDNTLAAVLGNNGGASALTKSGSGKWILTGNNTNSGTVTISAGTLQVGNGSNSGAIGSGNIVDNGTLIFNTSSTLTNGTITGTGSVDLEGPGTVVLPGNNTYSGAAGTTINNGTLQVGIGGATGSLNSSLPIALNNGTIIFDSTVSFNIAGFGANITGGGNLIKRGASLLKIFGNNTYSGWTEIGPGASLQVSEGAAGQFTSSVVTNYGSLIMGRQDNNTFFYSGNIVGPGSLSKVANNGNSGDVTLTGNHTYTGGTYILGGAIIFGDGGTPGAGSFVGNVFLTNDYAHNQFGTAPNDFVPATLIFNRPDDFIFPGDIVGEGFVTLTGSGVVTLTGNNNYTNRGTGATTTISAGTLQVGNGGTSGSIGTGSTIDNSVLVFNRSDSLTISRAISGVGSVVQFGSGTTTLTAANTYTGATTVSNGTLVVTGGTIGGDLNIEGGKFVPASLATGGSVNVTGNLNIDAGTVLAPLNKSSAVTNIAVAGTITRNGGSLSVTNVGPALAVNDKFYIFNQPVSGFATVTGAGATWQNDLATDGSITALTVPVTVNTTPTNMTAVVKSGKLELSWPADHTGWKLQAQTNSLASGLGTNWVSIPGTAADNHYTNTIDATKPAVFYRMVYP